MICCVLAVGKQHLGSHVVVGYGIKIFWPGLFITSPDHLAARVPPTSRVVYQLISNGNRTEWSPVRSVIIRVMTKSDDRAAGVRFVYHENDYRLNWTTRSPIIN